MGTVAAIASSGHEISSFIRYKTPRVSLPYDVGMTNWNALQEFLDARARAAVEGEFEPIEPLPANRVHSRELLRAIGARPSRTNFLRLAKIMRRLGWTHVPATYIRGKQLKGFVR
jgi:hypothetical protein